MASGGYILILAVLVLGGVIATLGDRIGTKVGKARLSLFNLRPKKTAVLVTVITGVLIAASTLGVLLLASRGFRDMLLRFDNIRADLDKTQKDLNQAKNDITKSGEEKKSIEAELGKSRAKSRQVQKTLNKLEASLKNVVARQQETEARRRAVEVQAQSLRSEISTLEREQQSLSAQRDQILAQVSDRDRELAERSGELAARDREILARKAVIAQRENSLKQLEVERQRLSQESTLLVQNVQALTLERNRLTDETRVLRVTTDRLREENGLTRTNLPVIRRDKILVGGVIAEARDPNVAVASLTRLLTLANDNASNAIRPGQPNQPILNLSEETQRELNRIKEKLQDGKQYLVQIRSAGNYFLDDRFSINITLRVEENRLIIPAGYTLGRFVMPSNELSLESFNDQSEQMLDQARSQAIRMGWNPDIDARHISAGKIRAFIEFFDQVQKLTPPVEIEAITVQPVYPGDPDIFIEFVAKQNGVVILRSRSLQPNEKP